MLATATALSNHASSAASADTLDASANACVAPIDCGLVLSVRQVMRISGCGGRTGSTTAPAQRESSQCKAHASLSNDEARSASRHRAARALTRRIDGSHRIAKWQDRNITA
jgi:hypothetical protein